MTLCLPTVAIFAICFVVTAVVVTAVVATSDGESSSVLLLPSQATGHRQDVCAGTPMPSKCPVKCFRADPVCGVDGVTYWCGCAEAACASAKITKIGFCEVGNGVSAPLSGQALLLVHIVWLIVLGFSVLFGLF